MLGASVEGSMRPRLLVVLALMFWIFLPAARGQVRPPLPDPVARAAQQRLELARKFRLHQALRRPADARSRMQDRYDVLFYRLDLRIPDPTVEVIYGDLTARVRVVDGPLDTLLFDLHDNMVVDSVFVDAQRADFVQNWYDLAVVPQTPAAQGGVTEARVYYHGHPVETGEAAFTFGSRGNIPVIWTLSEPFGAREWWPCKDRPDDKADSVDVIVRVPESLVASSNGVLVSNTLEADELRAFHWKHRYPITTYLVCVNVSNYVVLDDYFVQASGDTLPIEHYVYPEKVAQAREDFSITPLALRFFEESFGPYPFGREKYGHTIFPWGGGMEHQTNTSYGSGLVRGDHAYDYILVHELSHQWWGDMVSPADWRDIWLNEGFASYAEALWAEHRYGAEALGQYMTQAQYVAEPSGRVYDPEDLFDPSVVYNKGAWVLHMLRGIVGDSLFHDVLAEYRERTAYRSTTTSEFQAIAEEVSGQDLDYFFEPWLYGNGRPAYAVSFLSVGSAGAPRVAVHLTQTQRDLPYFPMPVDLRMRLGSGDAVRFRVMNDANHEDYEFALLDTVTTVTVDPDNWILKFTTMSNYTLNITTTDLPEAVAGDSIHVQLQGRGGNLPYRWTTQGPSPGGVTLDPDTGLLTGAAPDSGLYSFRVSLTDAAEGSDTQLYQWKVHPVPPDTTEVPVPGPLSLRVGPSPAHLTTSMSLQAPLGAQVALTILDLHGREVRKLWSGGVPAQPISWDGRNDRGLKVASGIYFCRLTGPGGAVTRRIVWLR
jgi:aminopeptidase N